MPAFKKPDERDYPQIKQYCAAGGYKCSEYAFGNFYMWQEEADTQISFKDGLLYMRSIYENGRRTYRMPVGTGDTGAAVDEMLRDAHDRGEILMIASVTDEMKNKIEAARPGLFDYTERRDQADYIYETKQMIELSGKKLHAKRNYINRFRAAWGDNYSFETIRQDNLDEVLEFNVKWNEQNEQYADNLLRSEKAAIEKCFKNYDQSGLTGGILRIGDDRRIAAFTYGSEINSDVFVIHVEKADIDAEGSYAAINNLFAKNILSGYKYINREEDMGLDGLRKAKLSYHPCEILMRYDALLRQVK